MECRATGRNRRPAPGPTDTRLYAYLTPHSSAAAALQRLTPSEQAQTAATVPPDIAQSLLPPEARAGLQRTSTGDLQLPGPRNDPGPLASGAYQGIYAVQVGDGLLVCLQTN